MYNDREYFYIGDKKNGSRNAESFSDIWKSILEYGLHSASHFEVRFPDDPALNEGKDEFLRLPKTSAEPWSGMEGAITVKGEMTDEARALFSRALEDDLHLWDFILFREGKKLLSVSDFIDRIVTEHFIKEFMGYLFQSWFEVIPEPELQERETDEQLLYRISDKIKEIIEKIRL